jgi:AbiU2
LGGDLSSDRKSNVASHAKTASKMLFRANVYFEAWLQSAGVDGRRQFKDFWQEHWEFWRFNEHAMLFAFIVYMAGLYEKRFDTVNFRSVWKNAKPYADTDQLNRYNLIWKSATPTAQSIAILRSNAMAHRSMKLSYIEAFKKANVTPDQLRDLLAHSWQLLNIIEEALGQKLSDYNPLPIETLRALVGTGS